MALLALILVALVAYPMVMLVLGSLTSVNPALEGFSSALTLQNFSEVFGSSIVRAAALNSIVACGLGTFFAVILGVSLAWIVARTNTPGRGWVEMAAIMPLFLPPLVAAVAWSYVGSPTTGIVNVVFKHWGWSIRLNLYSQAGIIAVFAMYYAPYVYMFVVAALKNMDPTLEEAAQMSGAGPVRTMLTVTFPLVAPAILSGSLLAFIVMFGIYGIPAALGTPARLDFLTTYLFKLTSWTPPLFNTAAAVALLLVFVTGICVALQHWALAGKSFVTVSGKSFRPRQLDLGRWRWFTFAIATLYALIAVVLPCFGLLVAAFRKFLFIPTLPSLFEARHYSTVHFEKLWASPLVWRSFRNTLEVGFLSAFVGGLLAFALAYTINRTRLPFRRTLDILATSPVAVPGLVIGVAYLWAWIAFAGALWGTTAILALALVARFLPDTLKVLSGSMGQIHPELEEASRVCGSGVLRTIGRIVVPLTAPGLISAMSLLFILSIRELGSSLFLFTNSTIVMPVLLLDFYEGGDSGATAAFSVLQALILLVVLGFANVISRAVARR
ncbi:ABC transporter permease [Enterovirga rhinocerotis]|uniref:ABC transporter permease n=1 Tax=Enterovirga rhinocerotis TaxID=1339210 RepID=UPI001FE1AFDE|nr:iron ABC transporter permease [Enterovirga rhinocerotis]